MHTIHTAVTTTMPDGTAVTSEVTIRSSGDPRNTAHHAQVAAFRAADDAIHDWEPTATTPRHADQHPVPAPVPPTYTQTIQPPINGATAHYQLTTDQRLPFRPAGS